MFGKKPLLIAIAGSFTILFMIAEARAQSDRTFVSTSGVDDAACGDLSTPCRDFATAFAHTNLGGEVIALDSGIYDSTNFTITRSVTLTAAAGIHAELAGTTSEGNFITVSTLASNATVVLRNLHISKQGNAGSVNGVFVTSVGALHIENCVITGFNYGIEFFLNAPAQVFIRDTVARNNAAAGVVFYSTLGNSIKASIDHSRFENDGGVGVLLIQSARVTARDTVASGNNAGFDAAGGDLSLENCEASSNNDGILTDGSGVVLVSNSTVTNNQTGFSQKNNSTFRSRGNNTVRRNGTNTSGTIDVVSGT